MKKTILCCLSLLLFSLLFSWKVVPSDEARKKLCVLVIASDNHPAFLELQNVWRSYMHLDPANIEVYFIKGGERQEIKGDCLYTPVEDSYRPGILKKTILSFEALPDRFDYVLRTNLSSFYDFPKLLKYLETLPKTRCYAARPLLPCSDVGHEYANIPFGWGAGFILSSDLVKLLVTNKEELFKNSDTVPDDVLIGAFLHQNGIPIISVPFADFRTFREWEEKKKTLSPGIFHFRAKSNDMNRKLEHTYEDELAILTELVQRTYPEVTPYAYQITYPLHMKLETVYVYHAAFPSDINQHLPRLRELARECASVTQIGMSGMVSPWGLLQGLSESSAETRSYLGIECQSPSNEALLLAKLLSCENDISFAFVKGSSFKVDIEPTDLLFIDSLHTYAHLTYELEKYASKVKKVIALHDTSEPWGENDDPEYRGDYSEYPVQIDRTKRGLWQAVCDFLERHPEWRLKERQINNHGLTILEKASVS